MHSLFLRIFMLFWVAMALIVGGSIAITFTIAAREYEAPELQRRPSVAVQAAEVLGRGGVPALKTWLSANRNAIPDRDLFIVGADGADILSRRLSEGAVRRLEFFNRDEFAGRRLPRAAPQIVAPDGRATAVLLVPRQPSIFGTGLPEISRHPRHRAGSERVTAGGWPTPEPIRRIQEERARSPRRISEVRVSGPQAAGTGSLLARADAMAEQLRANAAPSPSCCDISHELRSPLADARCPRPRAPAADAAAPARPPGTEIRRPIR